MYNLLLIPNLFALFLLSPLQNLKTSFVSLNINNSIYKLELADTSFKRSRGLMFKPVIENGMLFTFSTASRPGFYNKNVKFPLDFLWVGEDMVIKEHSQLTSNTFKSVFPKESIKYVIEFKQGDIENIEKLVGEKVEFILN